MKILIAEDDVVIRRLLQSFLEAWGHQIVGARDGVEAWELFQSGEFRMVLSDWVMPGMDGLELVRRIRSWSDAARAAGESAYVYTILLTGKTGTENLVQAMDAGADDFVCKPFDQGELRVRI